MGGGWSGERKGGDKVPDKERDRIAEWLSSSFNYVLDTSPKKEKSKRNHCLTVGLSFVSFHSVELMASTWSGRPGASGYRIRSFLVTWEVEGRKG
jgi:hypothetical protein